jgi:hypothetical protein
MQITELMQCQADLPHVIEALRPPRRFSPRLHRGKQQRNQHADNRDNNQQLDKRETARNARHNRIPSRHGR